MDTLTNQTVIEKVFRENPVLSRIRLKADEIQADYEKAKQDLHHLKHMGMLFVNEGFRATLAKHPLTKARNSPSFSLNDIVRACYALAEAFLLEGARQGDAWCYSTLGTVACRQGDIAAHSDLKCGYYTQAIAWYRWATALETPPIASGYPAITREAIDASTFYKLGHLYYMGLGDTVAVDHNKALESFEYGAQYNVPSCLFESAVLHMDQGELAKTAEESTRHFDLAFQRLNALIQTNVENSIADRVLIGCAYEQFSDAYKKGLGTQPDEEKANQFRELALAVFKEASKAGHLLARYKRSFLTAEDALKRADSSLYQKAIQLLDQAIAGPNNDYAAEAVTAKQAEAHLWAGRLWAKSKNGFKKACDRYYKAIKYGNDQAVIELAAIYYDGDGKKTYPKQARSVLENHLKNHPDDTQVQRFVDEIHFKTVAESTQSTPDDWFYYADFLHDCISPPGNNPSELKTRYLDAERWYRKASEAGHTDAMNGLAILLYTGSDKNDDHAPEKALQLWRMAASQGNSMAVDNLLALFFANAFEIDK